MPRIPTRDSLPQGAPQSTGGIVSAPRDFVGPALQKTGTALSDVAGKQMAREQQKQQQARQQRSALELANARSQWTSALRAGQQAYTPDRNPVYDNWSKTYQAHAPVWQKQAARAISDPGVRRQFVAETQADLEQAGIGIDRQARDLSLGTRRAQADRSLLLQVDSAASLPDEDGRTVMGGVRATLQDMVETGLITPADAAGRSVAYARQYASLKIAGLARQDPALAVALLSDEPPGPAALIRQLQPFRATPYWHAGAHRAGFGSDTVTRADGTVENISVGMTVTRADADRDVQRRADEIRARIGEQVGSKMFERLPPPVQAALVSVGYATGSLPDAVAQAVRSDDAEAIAVAIEADEEAGNAGEGDAGAGVNRPVRVAQAAIVRSGAGNAYEQMAQPPAWAGVLDREQKSALRAAAASEVDRHDARRALADRTEAHRLAQTIRSDMRAAYSTGTPGDIDPAGVMREMGPDRHRHWVEARHDAASVAEQTRDMAILPDDQIAQRVEALRAEPGSDDFARARAVHERVSRRADEIRRERTDNPARAALRVPSVRRALLAAQDPGSSSPDKIQALVREMLAAQAALGIAKAARAPVPDDHALRIGRALHAITTGQSGADADEVASAVRQMHSDIRLQYGEFADEVIAYSIGRTGALSSATAHQASELVKLLASAV